MNVTLLLPMKGNSERVPNKNLKLFNGKPLFHVILDKLVNSKYINNVIINTDSDLIAESALSKYHDFITIHRRPKSIQGDFVSMNKIIEYDLKNSNSDIYVQTHSTSPLLNVDSIDAAINNMISNKANFDSIFSVTKIQTRFYDKDGNAFNHNPKELLRTQDLEPLFEENSGFYIFTKDSFKNAGNKRIGLKPLMFEIDKIESIDIDEPLDFIIAETMHKLL
ncbi:acylneuraminate cytidylyltransferase family protein [Polaribacter sp.]|uniref:acylneuraminate cytidylyltransferase family protein n=1 Tax=Polaribacter sp. TaxID=1920175 RepID=UPI0025D1FAC2|nr:acylneuraminate cytidylyltransferase family protein [Polaribacter sp.]